MAHTLAWGHVSTVVTSRAVLVRVAARIWAFTIRKNFNYDHPMGCPDVPEFPLITAWPVRRLGLAPKAHTRTHHTRFTSFGWARVCGWSAKMMKNQLVEGERKVPSQ